MMRNKPIVEDHIKWKIQSGSCSFWWDNWLDDGPIAHHCNSITNLNNTIVSYFINEGTWNESLVRLHDPPLLVPEILSTRIYYQDNERDEQFGRQLTLVCLCVFLSGKLSEKREL